MVRVRRILPVPRTGGGLSPRPAGLAREVRRRRPTRSSRKGPARACLLRPASGDELRRAVALAERAGAVDRAKAQAIYPFFQFVQGLAEYRQGRLDRAISLMRGEASGVLGPAPRLVLAMALHQSGRVAEARKTLAEAVLSYDWRAANGARPGRLDLPCPPPRGRDHDPAGPAGVPGRERTNPGTTTSGSPCSGSASSRIAPAPWPASTPMPSPQPRNWRRISQPATATTPPARPPWPASATAKTREISARRSERAGVSRRSPGWNSTSLPGPGRLDSGIAVDRHLVRRTLTALAGRPGLGRAARAGRAGNVARRGTG